MMTLVNMKLFSLNDYNDFYEKTKYQLTLRLSIAICFILTLLGITFIAFDLEVVYLNFIGLAVTLAIITLVLITKKYKVAAAIFTITGGLLTIYTLLSLNYDYHFVDPLWMIIIALFAYFTLGKVAGNITILIQFIAVVYYLIFDLTTNLKNLKPLTLGEQYSLAVNAFLCATLIAYLIHQFLKRNAYAASQYRALTQELKIKNELVESQNMEKTAMLKEIHHRVKNNLQVITSLLRLQSRDLTNDETIKHFNEAIDRVGAMALIHNQMYQSKDLDRIQLEPYLRSLSANILSSYTVDIPVNISFNIALKHTRSNLIVPLALIFNELISNSIKHAFKTKDSGEITIEIIEKKPNKIEISYGDNGLWLQPKKEDSFGFELIDTLTQQLNGHFERKIENGTTYTFILNADMD